jgi:hypothetical protein
MDVTQVRPPLVKIPTFVAKAIAQGLDLSINPRLTPDLITRMTMDILPDAEDESLLTFNDVGIDPMEMEEAAFNYLFRHRPGGHFRYVGGYYNKQDQTTMREHAPA